MTPGLLALFLLGHLFGADGRLAPVGRLHYWTHAAYAKLEPLVIRLADLMLRRRFFTGHPAGRFLLWLVARTNVFLPHGVVIPTPAAARILREIAAAPGAEAHIAVGPCVCQRNLRRFREPVEKDITVLYGAEIYRRFFPAYRPLALEEALGLLQKYHAAGLTPVAEFLMQSGRWMFVLCNCDQEVCCPTRLYNAVGRSLYPGPYQARQDLEKCLGLERCGQCLPRCHFHANRSQGDKVMLDPERCLGCGLCVTTCRGQARKLVRRPGYTGRLLPFDRAAAPELADE
jgi:ferredoxin